MNNKLSPGPWKIEEREYFVAILDAEGAKIAEVHCRNPNRGGSKERRRANALAMAAAWNYAQQPAEGNF